MKSKFKASHHPILLAKESALAQAIVNDIHHRCSHAGIFTVLRELRREFWLLNGFSMVRRILRQCVVCKKLNERPIQINLNSYRDFRCDPPKIPFSSIFIDHIGPINARYGGEVKKIWLLLITCLFTRAVSIKISLSADVQEFLRCLQMHVF